MTRPACGVFALVGLLLAAPVEAQDARAPFSGQGTVHIGVASGNDGRGSALSLGGSMAVLGASGWGAELDFGFAADDNGPAGGLDVQSYMLNVMGMWPKRGLRPFVAVGAGVLHARTCVAGCAETLAWTDWGLSAGGGVQYALRDSFAVRGDVRYLMTLLDHPDPNRPSSFNVWRVSIGGTYLWNIVD